MIIFAPSKINLGLAIQAKREDGYHELSSIFYPIPVFDLLEILPADEFSLKVLGLQVDGSLQDNLVYKAYDLMRKQYGISPCRIVLQKNIPMGAGLGGGSSNATHVIKGLNDFYSLNLTEAQLANLSLTLGSDCPFFVENKPKIVEGRGEQMTTCALDLSAYYLHLIYPGIHIGTAEAFANTTPYLRKGIEKKWLSSEVENWKQNMENDFEKTVFLKHPVLDEIKEEMYANGAIYSSMSGSGSSIFGLYKQKPKSLDKSYGQEWIVSLADPII